MPFDNFYEESDKARRRWWKCFGLAILLLIGYWSVALLIIPKVEDDRNLEKDLKTANFDKSERLRRVDDLCTDLPKPEQFNFLEKEIPKNSADSTSIIYRFRTDRSPEEIMPFFLIWFNANGWKSFAKNVPMYKKDKQTISVEVSSPFDEVSDYEIQCYESNY